MSGHDINGESVFVKVSPRLYVGLVETSSLQEDLQTDHGDHGAPMLGGAAAQTIFYSSDSNPIQLTDDVDLEFIKQQVITSLPTLPSVTLRAKG